MIYVWSLLAGGAAVTLEGVYSRADRFREVVWWCVALQPVIAYSIFRMVKMSPSIVSAIVAFSMATLALRVIVSICLGQPVTRGQWLAVCLIMLAQIARRF